MKLYDAVILKGSQDGGSSHSMEDRLFEDRLV